MTIKVDLLPTEKKGFGIDPAMVIMIILVIVAFTGMMVYSTSLKSQIDRQTATNEEVNQEIKQIQSQLPLIEESKKRIASLEREIKMIKSLVHDPLRYANLLQEIAILLPENVWLDDLSIVPQGNKVNFSGHAAEVVGQRKPLATIADLMRNFNDSEYFTNSTLDSTAETAGKDGSPSVFSFKLAIDYDPEKAASEPPTGMGAGSVPHVEADKAPAANASPAPADSATPSASASPSATATP